METRKSKKSFKKKALLSSLSMLMVATVAVGSATFAWFTNNKSVTANGMSVKAAAAKGLQITGSNDDTTFGPSYTFTTTQATLSPVSVAYSTSASAYSTKLGTPYAPDKVDVTGAWSTENTDITNFNTVAYPATAIIDDITTKDATVKNNSFIAYQVGVRSTGDDIANVQLKVKLTDKTGTEKANASQYMRVAVVKQAAKGTANYTNDGLTAVYGSETNANAIASQTPTVAPQKVDPSETSINIGTVTKNATYYTVLVWFEGQDAECVDANQQAEGSIEINFSYTD